MTTGLSSVDPLVDLPAASRVGDPGRPEIGTEHLERSGSPGRQPQTVMHLVREMNRGGAELRTVELMRRLDPNEFRLVFCSLSGRRGALDDEIRSLGGEVYYCRLGPAFPLAFYLLLRRLRPQVVHAYASNSTGLVFGIARMAGVPRRVAHFRNSADWPGDSAGQLGNASSWFGDGADWSGGRNSQFDSRNGQFGDSANRRGRSIGGLLRRTVGRAALDANATDLLAVCEAVMRELWRP
ncbi:glycosyltransferase, partial [Candidatus Protofrankia californiensis]|uniref:glycosyltransferase n=1 Tax=Candidatus Protofrankia californiensis TaxID=1839754 RepID=UPI003204B101